MDLERFEKMGNDIERIPYIAHESALARSERTIKRLIIALVLSIVLMFASNGIWLYAFSQFEYVDETTTTTTTVKQDGKGQNVYGDNNKLNEPNNNNSKEKTQKNDAKKER